MCGIFAYIGKNNTIKNIIEGLKQLQNRGYDSAGYCCLSNDNQFILEKFASDNISALDKLEKLDYKNYNLGIGHTRWATHGPKTDTNSHPHNDMTNNFSLVHNGIIENYLEIKKFLLKNNYTFKSETDTEIIVNLISYKYNLSNDIERAIKETADELSGTYALCIISKFSPGKIYCVRHGSPLLIGSNENEIIVTSEQSGFCNKVNSYICLNNSDLSILSFIDNKLEIKTKSEYKKKSVNICDIKLTPDPYDHWMIKEIIEQKESSLRAISLGGRLLNDNSVRLGGFEDSEENLLKTDNLILLGCGTSYFAGLTSLKYFKELCDFNIINIIDGAEFNEYDIPKIGKTSVILLSQSGETKDLHRCINIARKNDLFIIGVVNVVDSLIARESDCGCYLNAGREVAVASTKSFTSQVIILSMIAVWFSQKKDINNIKRKRYITDLRNIHIDINSILNNKEEFKKIIPSLIEKNSLFILGKGNLEAIAKEGSLKIKEVTYIHAEGYSGSSLKHGPFGLLEKDFPVILIDTDSNHNSKMSNVYEQVKSRHAKVITITNNINYERDDMYIIPNNKTFNNILSVIPLQLLSYYLSIEKGYNPDFPRNLAKVVTVE
jgi:glucosamine--fructose-6-phosphate aminotransferase (isomerizing)